MQFWLFAVDFWIAAGLIKFDWMIEDIQSSSKLIKQQWNQLSKLQPAIQPSSQD